jgi:branched-chain amino acid transport system permease protein
MKISEQNYFKKGMIGGIIVAYFSAIGMVTSFADRFLIGEILSMGHLIFFGGALWVGISLGQDNKSSTFKSALKNATLGGIFTAIPMTFLYFFASQFNLREVFINLSPDLLAFLDFGFGTIGVFITALIIILLVVIVVSFQFIPRKIAQIISNGVIWTIGLAVFSELVTQILSNAFGRGIVRVIFFEGAFHIHIAIILFIVVMAITYATQKRDENKSGNEIALLSEEEKSKKDKIRLAIIVFVIVVFPWVAGRFLSQVAFKVGLYVLMGLGLNIVVGYAGLLDLGYVAFFAFGAYTMGLLTTTTDLVMANGTINFWLALPIAMVVAIAFGVMLGFPVLRMRGDYLAIVTLGFGEIIRILALSDWLGKWMGGAQGVLKMKTPEFFGVVMNTPETMYYLVIIGSIMVGFVSVRLRDSRLGRQWMAMREDEDVAEAMGINLISTKLLAFGIGAGFSGLAGAIFSGRLGNIFPHSFNLIISVNVLSLIIVGGLASIPGVIVGAIILVGMPELLREFQEYRLLLYGILLIIMMLNKPEGFLPAEIYKREHSDQAPENAGSQE